MKHREISEQNRAQSRNKPKIKKTNLSSRFHSFPDAEIAEDPGYEQTQGQIPI